MLLFIILLCVTLWLIPCLSSYADTVDNYFTEEETRFFLPTKEYIGFCDSLRYNTYNRQNIFASKFFLFLSRTVVRRQELLQKQLEKNEEIVSSKAEARDALKKDVHFLWHIFLFNVSSFRIQRKVVVVVRNSPLRVYQLVFEEKTLAMKLS